MSTQIRERMGFVIGFVFITLLMAIFMFGSEVTCKFKDMFSKDLYCFDKAEAQYCPDYIYCPKYNYQNNLSYDSFGDICLSYNVNCHWVLGNYTQDVIDKKNFEEHKRIENERKEAEAKCYNEGYDFNGTFDIIKDYNLSCKKIAYINDHLVDKQADGGYIHGDYYQSGFFSYGYGSIEGRFNIFKESLATGELVKGLSYHVNCRNETVAQVIVYYDESDFILYYTERCL